ncbi:MAG: glutathione S-transferase family protein [Microvirga sp.]
MTGLKLYYSPGACSLAPHIALEEAGVAYEPVKVALAKGEQRTPEYLAINPKGRVPVLAEDDWVLTENAAILPYIAQRFPEARLWPSDPREAARTAEWIGWIASTVHIAYAHVRRPERYAADPKAIEDVIAKGKESCRDIWGQVDKKLGSGPWAVGKGYSVADPYLLVFWTWGRGPTLGFDMAKDFPNWTAHARRMGERAAVKRAFEREALELPA